ncbi:MAG: MnhB domain-containing protein [Elusimicrobiota bacterium]
MDKTIKILTSYVIGLILVFGCYVVIYGHILPGEGFDGGMLIASAFILCMIVYGKDEARKRINFSTALVVSAISGLLLIVIGFIGLVGYREGHKFFFDNFLPQGNPHQLFSGGIVPICNVLLGFLVGFGFYALFGYLVVFRNER